MTIHAKYCKLPWEKLLAVTRDITERKRKEKEIINSEHKFRILTENAPIGIYNNDFNGKFLYSNKKSEEIIGYQNDELIGNNFLKLNLLNHKYLLMTNSLKTYRKLIETNK